MASTVDEAVGMFVPLPSSELNLDFHTFLIHSSDEARSAEGRSLQPSVPRRTHGLSRCFSGGGTSSIVQ